jgi:hypothetical protein
MNIPPLSSKGAAAVFVGTSTFETPKQGKVEVQINSTRCDADMSCIEKKITKRVMEDTKGSWKGLGEK